MQFQGLVGDCPPNRFAGYSKGATVKLVESTPPFRIRCSRLGSIQGITQDAGLITDRLGLNRLLFVTLYTCTKPTEHSRRLADINIHLRIERDNLLDTVEARWQNQLIFVCVFAFIMVTLFSKTLLNLLM